MRKGVVVSAMSLGLLAISGCSSHAAQAGGAAGSPPPQAAAAREAKYVPQFTTMKTEFGHYWILDHGQPIALLGCEKQETTSYQIGLFRQFPGQQIEEQKFKDYEFLDFVYLPGLRLNTNWISAPSMKGVPGQMQLDSSDPTQLVIRLSWKKNAEEFGTQTLRVVYDRDLARYVIHVEDNLQVTQAGGGEFCNFYANGLGDFRPDVKRYDLLLYQDAEDGGKLKAHHLSVLIPKPTPDLIRLPATNALVGYASEKDGNPVVIIEESTPGATDGICLCWFDSHLRWDEPSKKSHNSTATISGPPYRYHVKFKAYWNTAAETGALLAKAQTVSLVPFAEKFQGVLPVDMNVVNDFEHQADFRAGDVKHIYLPMSKNDGGIKYDTTVGRSGHSSIQFSCTSDKGLKLSPIGPELMVTPGRQVKIRAWVKTADVTGEGFYLETGFMRWIPTGHEQFGPVYQSAKLTGTHDWTLLEIPLPLTPAKTEYMGTGKGRITFHLSGQGTAWVDDFVFSEQEAAPARVASAKP